MVRPRHCALVALDDGAHKIKRRLHRQLAIMMRPSFAVAMGRMPRLKSKTSHPTGGLGSAALAAGLFALGAHVLGILYTLVASSPLGALVLLVCAWMAEAAGEPARLVHVIGVGAALAARSPSPALLMRIGAALPRRWRWGRCSGRGS